MKVGDFATLPQTQHVKRHFTAGEVVRDIILGMSDGLNVPFALAAGLSGAVSTTRVIVTAGLAEIVAGSIAMGLGGYSHSRNDAEHCESESSREQSEIAEMPDTEAHEVGEVFEVFGLTPEESTPIVQVLQRNPKAWIDFMMRFELGLENPQPRRSLTSSLTIAGAYIAGGVIGVTLFSRENCTLKTSCVMGGSFWSTESGSVFARRTPLLSGLDRSVLPDQLELSRVAEVEQSGNHAEDPLVISELAPPDPCHAPPFLETGEVVFDGDPLHRK